MSEEGPFILGLCFGIVVSSLLYFHVCRLEWRKEAIAHCGAQWTLNDDEAEFRWKPCPEEAKK